MGSLRSLPAGLVLTFAMAAAGAAPVSPAFEAECLEQARQTTVETKFDPGDVSFDLTRSAAELTSMKSSGGRWRTSGLTTMTQKFSIRARARVIHDSDGHACALPRFELDVTVQPQQVYIGREFARGSCSFEEIARHEMRHVQANRDHAMRVTRAFEVELRRAFATAPLIGDAATLNERLTTALQVDWLPRLKSDLERGGQLHAVIDSEAEFDRLSRACDGEISATLAPRASK